MNLRSLLQFAIMPMLAVSFLTLAPTAFGQSNAQKQGGPEQSPQIPHWSVAVSKGEPLRVTLRAEDAPLERVATAVADKLGAPVVLSQLMKARRVTAEIADAPLEVVLRSLAPQVYLDCMLGGGYETQPKYIGVYLQGVNEIAPPVTAGTKARSEAVLIEGDTEDPESLPGAKAKTGDEPGLQVSFERRRLLNVRARKQPLTAVLYEIASKLGAPFEMQYESAETVDLDWAGDSVADLWRLLPRHAQLYQRADLSNNESKTLRIVLLKPTKD
jgi:hypothetical protein